MNLARILKERNNPVVFCFKHGEQLTSELADVVTNLRDGLFAELRGKRVSLVCSDTSLYFTSLIALDGWASEILLLDASLSSELLLHFETTVTSAARIRVESEKITLKSLNIINADPPVALLEGETSWIIPTSGTTGTPKLVAHTLSSLSRTVKKAKKATSELRWGLLYDPTRFAGLQVFMQSFIGEGTLITPADWRNVDEACQLLEANKCNALSATPSFWRKLAMSGWLEKLDFKLITLGGEAPDQKILDLLAKKYPHAVIRHIYASTEAGVGFSVSDGYIGFPVDYLKSSDQGVSIKIREDGMLLLRPKQIKQKMIAEKTLHTTDLCDSEGWIVSGDLVEIKEDRVFFLGRENGAINVGGQKVHPTQVENVIAQVDGVISVRAYGVPSSILGNLVAAEIVAEDDVNLVDLESNINEVCFSQLTRFQRPTAIRFIDQIELTNTGKIKR